MCYDCHNMVRGTDLPQSLRREALARYVHRFTRDHVPAWSRQEWKDGLTYPVQFGSDSDWLAHTTFPLSKDGKRLLDAPCCSTPTWPENPELHKVKA